MADFDDLVQVQEPPAKRKARAEGGVEKKLTEAAVMLAFVMHLFEDNPKITTAEIHPDGEHGKRFDIRGWLEKHGFEMVKPLGTTSYGGEYKRDNKALIVSLKPGLGDVVAFAETHTIVAECKGGVINSKHAGQVSRLRSGLCEVVGLLMSRAPDAERHVAVVPKIEATLRLAESMASRCSLAGIEIALVNERGGIDYVGR